jgi:hypothetical protein
MGDVDLVSPEVLPSHLVGSVLWDLDVLAGQDQWSVRKDMVTDSVYHVGSGG